MSKGLWQPAFRRARQPLGLSHATIRAETRLFRTRTSVSADFRRTEPPRPGWKFGDGANDESWIRDGKQPRTVFDMERLSTRDKYRLLTSAIVPRPIAFVSTLSSDGMPNLAPFSYFSMVGHKPPMLSVSFSISPSRPKDSRENILATKQFTVNIISELMVEGANATSVESPAEVNEWKIAGFTPIPSIDVMPPIVEESALSMECELYEHFDIKDPEQTDRVATTVVLGLIRQVHARPSILQDDGITIHPARLAPIARLSGTMYSRLNEAFDLPRWSWSKDVKHWYDPNK